MYELILFAFWLASHTRYVDRFISTCKVCHYISDIWEVNVKYKYDKIVVFCVMTLFIFVFSISQYQWAKLGRGYLV